MLDFMAELFNKFAKLLLTVLPTSPFRPYLDDFASLPYLSYLNWFIPIKDFIIIGTSWLVAIGLFYLYGIVMRWVKMIGD